LNDTTRRPAGRRAFAAAAPSHHPAVRWERKEGLGLGPLQHVGADIVWTPVRRPNGAVCVLERREAVSCRRTAFRLARQSISNVLPIWFSKHKITLHKIWRPPANSSSTRQYHAVSVAMKT
jgi:hypothetical protein